MKSITCLLAAGILLLPASGMAAEQEAEIHAVMAAEESHTEDAAAPAKEDGGASAAARAETSEEKDDATHDDALDKEMEAVGDGDSHADAAGKSDTDNARETKPAANADAPAAADTATDADTAPGTIGFITELPEDETNASVNKPRMTDAADKAAVAAAAAAKREAYGKETAIEPVTLKDGDWVFIEGDERRGWFFDRSHMKRNADGSISYWQLILYNNLGRAQFAEAMKNADYEHLGYTMQRRVLSPKKDAISTYEILAYDGDNALITESSREGHRAVIRANTMTEKERDAVRQELRRKK